MGQASICAGFVTLIFLQSVSTYNLVCYFTNWSQYRSHGGRFVPETIDANLCTHIIYAFANISSSDQINHAEWNDDSTYETLNSLKTTNPHLKILLSAGGFGKGSKALSKIAASPVRRLNFVTSAVRYLRENRFDGFDLDWIAPEEGDKKRLVNLVKDLSIQFKREAMKERNQKLILSVAVQAGREAMDKGYNIAAISESADFINFVTYDFHGAWDGVTGHGSPLYKGKNDFGSASYYNVDYSVKYLISKGAPPKKIMMSIPTFGRTFELASRQTGIGVATSGPGTPGPITQESGILSYYEICDFNHGAKKERIEEQLVPYSHKGNQWVAYEDVTSVQAKVQYMKENNLGGIVIWSLDLDDFSGSACHQGNYPLVAAVKEELNKNN